MAKKKTQHKAKSFSEALGLEYLFNNTITDFFLGLISVSYTHLTLPANREVEILVGGGILNIKK